jgi:hypothetical protein
MLGENDVLLCTEHALLAVDTDLQSLAEVKELIVLLADEAHAPATTRRSADAPARSHRHSAAST